MRTFALGQCADYARASYAIYALMRSAITASCSAAVLLAKTKTAMHFSMAYFIFNQS